MLPFLDGRLAGHPCGASTTYVGQAKSEARGRGPDGEVDVAVDGADVVLTGEWPKD